jgi:hypothetical protein
LLLLALIQRSRNPAEAEVEDGEAKAIKDKDKEKDNEEEEEDNQEEEEVINLLPTTANTASISHPFSGLTTTEEEAAKVDGVGPTPLAMRATALTPATTVLTLATPAPSRWAIGLRQDSGKLDQGSGLHTCTSLNGGNITNNNNNNFVANVWRTNLAISCFGVGLQGGAQHPVHQIAVGHVKIDALFDKGAESSLISSNVYDSLSGPKQPQLSNCPLKLTTADGGHMSIRGQCVVPFLLGS